MIVPALRARDSLSASRSLTRRADRSRVDQRAERCICVHPFLRPALFLRFSLSTDPRLVLSLFLFVSVFLPLSLSLPSPALVVRVRATECERARDSEIVIAVVSTDWISYLVRTENWCYINQSTTPKITPSRFVVVVVQVDWPALRRARSGREIIVIYPLFKRDTSYKRKRFVCLRGESRKGGGQRLICRGSYFSIPFSNSMRILDDFQVRRNLIW